MVGTCFPTILQKRFSNTLISPFLVNVNIDNVKMRYILIAKFKWIENVLTYNILK
jgi:hypothetical protein